jgi:hypothetical protein
VVAAKLARHVRGKPVRDRSDALARGAHGLVLPRRHGTKLLIR